MKRHYNTEFLELNVISYIKQVFPILRNPQIPLLTFIYNFGYSGTDCIIYEGWLILMVDYYDYVIDDYCYGFVYAYIVLD